MATLHEEAERHKPENDFTDPVVVEDLKSVGVARREKIFALDDKDELHDMPPLADTLRLGRPHPMRASESQFSNRHGRLNNLAG